MVAQTQKFKIMKNLTVISWSTEDNISTAKIKIDNEEITLQGSFDTVKNMMIKLKSSFNLIEG